MNSIIDALKHRRSVRAYSTGSIDTAKLNTVLEAGLLAPTGRNIRGTEFVLVENRLMLDKLSEARKAGGTMLKQAAAAIVVIADDNLSDLWQEDASIAMAYMHLTADSLGLGSCWVQVWAREDNAGNSAEHQIQSLLNLSSNKRVVAMLALGNIAEHPDSKAVTDSDWQRVSRI